MALALKGVDGTLSVDGETSSRLLRWSLDVEDGRPEAEEDERPPEAGRAVLSIHRQEPDPFWAQYTPTEARLRVGRSCWAFRVVTAISPDSLLLAGTPKVESYE
jgi:hypothetical protein